jgi:hypothetical protein
LKKRNADCECACQECKDGNCPDCTDAECDEPNCEAERNKKVAADNARQIAKAKTRLIEISQTL